MQNPNCSLNNLNMFVICDLFYTVYEKTAT